jgi:nucleoside-diphosphate-sugar epimerase
MRVLVVGGTGHIGSYLVPRLIRAGFDVTVTARSAKPKYAVAELGWNKVEWMLCDRAAEEKTGAWSERMAKVETEAVVDLITYTQEQNAAMVRAFEGRIRHFIHCGSIWAYGPSLRVPHLEQDPRNPLSSYGRKKAAIENDLMDRRFRASFPATGIHPGHISGKRWLPIDPRGALDGTGIYRKLARGEQVVLPERGAVPMHHVHGDDVAQVFERALLRPADSIGQAFSAVSPYALTMRACCRAVATLFGAEPNLSFCSLNDLSGDPSFGCIKSHVEESVVASCEKAERLLGYRPRYTTEDIYAECVEFMLESGSLTTT